MMTPSFARLNCNKDNIRHMQLSSQQIDRVIEITREAGRAIMGVYTDLMNKILKKVLTRLWQVKKTMVAR